MQSNGTFSSGLLKGCPHTWRASWDYLRWSGSFQEVISGFTLLSLVGQVHWILVALWGDYQYPVLSGKTFAQIWPDDRRHFHHPTLLQFKVRCAAGWGVAFPAQIPAAKNLNPKSEVFIHVSDGELVPTTWKVRKLEGTGGAWCNGGRVTVTKVTSLQWHELPSQSPAFLLLQIVGVVSPSFAIYLLLSK